MLQCQIHATETVSGCGKALRLGLIGEACFGWTCKTSQRGQREESIAKYREWYETLADGKTWYLGAHIGKGTSRDPRHTIRIGFARDEEGHRVIVGFIGRLALTR